ncbi:MAG TPA: mycofactocin precursor MftA [Streptosporangiaceae bacterium]
MNTDVIETGAPVTAADDQPAPEAAEVPAVQDLTADDLIEEISIDGMCGVY